jgi:hypothetical protein
MKQQSDSAESCGTFRFEYVDYRTTAARWVRTDKLINQKHKYTSLLNVVYKCINGTVRTLSLYPTNLFTEHV